MLLDLDQMRVVRRRLGMTQAELAKRVGVSQSYVTKLENGSLEPAYSKAKQLLDVLVAESMRRATEAKASQMMDSRPVYLDPEQKVADAYPLLRMACDGALTVMRRGTPIGLLRRESCLQQLSGTAKVGDIMDAPPPVVPPSTTIACLASLLQWFPVVLVAGTHGDVAGSICRDHVLDRIMGPSAGTSGWRRDGSRAPQGVGNHPTDVRRAGRLAAWACFTAASPARAAWTRCRLPWQSMSANRPRL